MKIAVGQGSCGIAAGAGKVYSAIESLLEDKQILTITGCVGMCFLEPIVDIYDNDNKLHRLVKVKEEDAENIVKAVEEKDFSYVENILISAED